VVRAAHRAQHHLVVAAADRCEHVVAVVREMAAALVQLGPGERRGVDVGVPGAALHVDDVRGERIPHRAALRQPQRQAGADQLGGGEQLQVTAEAAMVDEVLTCHRAARAGGARFVDRGRHSGSPWLVKDRPRTAQRPGAGPGRSLQGVLR
jgi:hypothetical protein